MLVFCYIFHIHCSDTVHGYWSVRVKEAELELCKDDNEQLVTQYEREKHLRKSAEQVTLVSSSCCIPF